MRKLITAIIALSLLCGCASTWKKLSKPFKKKHKICTSVCDCYGNCEKTCK